MKRAILFLCLFIASAFSLALAPAPVLIRLVQPWSLLKSLTSEQKTNIHAIHDRYLEEQRQLREKEKAEIMALLTPAQKAELQSLLEQKTIANKLRHANPPAPAPTPSTTPTTHPTNNTPLQTPDEEE